MPKNRNMQNILQKYENVDLHPTPLPGGRRRSSGVGASPHLHVFVMCFLFAEKGQFIMYPYQLQITRTCHKCQNMSKFCWRPKVWPSGPPPSSQKCGKNKVLRMACGGIQNYSHINYDPSISIYPNSPIYHIVESLKPSHLYFFSIFFPMIP